MPDESDLSPLGRVAKTHYPGARDEIAEYVSTLERALERIATEQLDHDEILTISLHATRLECPWGVEDEDIFSGCIDELTMALREAVREARPMVFADRRLRWIRVSYPRLN